MATISFRAKVESVYHASDDTLAFRFVRVPTLQRRHCDMDSFRRHPKLGGIANSDLFPGALRRILADRKMTETLRLDRLPEGVTVDDSGFLAVVTVNVP